MILYLCSGTKNSFIITTEEDLINWDSLSSNNKKNRQALAKEFCSIVGSRSDGFVIVKKTPESLLNQFEWDFFNNDGSRAEMCGNAARCVAYFVKNYMGFDKDEFNFQTLSGSVGVKVLGNNYFRVKMPPHKITTLWEEEFINNKSFKYCFINSGVPHAVIELPNFDRLIMDAIIKKMRFYNKFGTAGANISFYSKTDSEISGITYERGVENYTNSCGTGAVAIALSIFSKENKIEDSINRVKIQTPGGELIIELDISKKFCWLMGPAGLEEEIHIY